MRKLLIISIILTSLSSFATIFTVTNTNDSGAGSLRQAIDYANGMSGTHSIEFNIPTSDAGYNSTLGVWEFNPETTYSYIIRDNLTIDGTTQTVNQGNTNTFGPEIVINGNDNSIDYCFSVINASGITIKGFCIIEFAMGIQIFGDESTGCFIKGNYIGITPDSDTVAGNDIGIEIIGGPSLNYVGGTNAEDRNIVSGNEHIGIRIVDANNNAVAGNYVGLDRTGTIAMPNYDGVSIEGSASNNSVGGILPEQRNVVSGNFAYGIPVFGAGCNYNTIIGNYIGTDVTGTISIPNTYGVLFDDGAGYNVIGGDSSSSRNILSGNSGYGVFIYNLGTHDNIVKNNFIGTDVTGTAALPNANGIVIDGAAINSQISYNVISGNLQQGIAVHITGCDGNVMENNFIGTDFTGTLPLGNGVDGIRIAEGPINNVVGPGNIIAFNGGTGVTVMNDVDDKNLITQNSIFSNQGLGIDLFPAGVNDNDSGDGDTGPNQGMNFPEINNIEWATGTATISGTLDTYDPEYCTIEFFIAEPDGMGYGEGKTYLGNVSPDISGNWIFMAPGVNETDYFTAVAIDSANNTSEFSICRNVYGPALIRTLMDVKLNVYPNPAAEMLFVKSENICFLEISDVIGKPVKKYSFHNQKSVTIDISEFSEGIYFLKTENGVVKFVVGR